MRILCPCGHMLDYKVECVVEPPPPNTTHPTCRTVLPDENDYKWGVVVYHRGGRHVRSRWSTRAMARFARKQYVAKVAEMHLQDNKTPGIHWWSDKR